MTTTWSRQTTKYSCGAHSVAMATGTPVENVFRFVGHNGSAVPFSRRALNLYLASQGKVLGIPPAWAVPKYASIQKGSKQGVMLRSDLADAMTALYKGDPEAVEEVIEGLLAKHLDEKGYKADSTNVCRQEGLNAKELTRLEGFQVICDVRQPALVTVATEDEELAHAVYWNGRQIFDPAAKDAETDIEKYKVLFFEPIINLKWFNTPWEQGLESAEFFLKNG